MEQAIITKLGIIPIAQEFIEELGIVELIDSHVESGKEQISAGQVVNVLLLNLLDSSSPLYKVSDWLSGYADGLGEFGSEALKFHDKRLGATLDALYQSSRHDILTQLSGRAIALHDLDTDIIHNDTTTVTFTGAYQRDQARDSELVLTHGYNKDHRPDYKQIVFGLNVSSDGYVPLLAQLYSGNTSDDKTHQVNWQGLRQMLGRTDFIYIADSKLSTTQNLEYIAAAGGQFISILPATRKEVQDFHKELEQVQQPDSSTLLPWQWPQAYQVENTRKKGSFIVYRIKQGAKTKEGFDLVWVHSSAKAEQDSQRRQKAIAKAEQSLQELSQKLNQYYLKTEQQIQSYLKKQLGKAGQYFDIQIVKQEQVVKKKIGPGRPGPNSKWDEQCLVSYELQYRLKQEKIRAAANKDGIFPLVTNTELQAAQVLRNYKNQPYLEKRFHTLKSVLQVAPMFLKKPERIEAMLLLYIIALMLIALIERRIRKNMQQQQIPTLPILPQGMKTKRPTWANIKFCFNSAVMLSFLLADGQQYQHLVKGLATQQLKVLDLLKVPVERYYSMTPQWWKSISIRGQ